LTARQVVILWSLGDADFICNWIGNKAWTLELQWTGSGEFNAAKDQPWLVGKQEMGQVRTAGPLTFLRIYSAGHMVRGSMPCWKSIFVQPSLLGAF
jgi:cathepsin A (carboxypeptidase C)